MRRSSHHLFLLVLMGCDLAPEPLPPFAETVVSVDTNVHPAILNRLRIDLYTLDGRWFLSRDIPVSTQDWPLSFSVWSEVAPEQATWIRLRAYPSGKVRDYLGERFADWPEVLTGSVTPTFSPRLIQDGFDTTPTTEPEPLLALDRLLQVGIRQDIRTYASVVLDGECLGTMASFGSLDRPVLDQASTCDYVHGQRTVVSLASSSEVQPVALSVSGTWLNQPCSQPSSNDRVCIPSGELVLGDRNLILNDTLDSAPERLVGVRRFEISTHEVLVQEFRQALAEGFSPTQFPIENNSSFVPSNGKDGCAYSSNPLGREDFPVNCVPWRTARDYCLFRGGDLPSEVQWEYAATTAGRAIKTTFPWGEDLPTCGGVLFGRIALAGTEGLCEESSSELRLGGVSFPQDRTSLGVLGLAGGVAEWTLDAARPYSDPCWAHDTVEPACALTDGNRSVRGGSWGAPMPLLMSVVRTSRNPEQWSPFVGFRCTWRSQ